MEGSEGGGREGGREGGGREGASEGMRRRGREILTSNGERKIERYEVFMVTNDPDKLQLQTAQVLTTTTITRDNHTNTHIGSAD